MPILLPPPFNCAVMVIFCSAWRDKFLNFGSVIEGIEQNWMLFKFIVKYSVLMKCPIGHWSISKPARLQKSKYSSRLNLLETGDWVEREDSQIVIIFRSFVFRNSALCLSFYRLLYLTTTTSISVLLIIEGRGLSSAYCEALFSINNSEKTIIIADIWDVIFQP